MPSGVSTSTVRRYLCPGRLIRIWSPTTSTARSASGPIHLEITLKGCMHLLCTSVEPASNRRLIPGTFGERVLCETGGVGVTDMSDQRLVARNDLAWAIAVGGIGIVLFASLLWFAWHFAATLFLIFAGMLLGVGLNAMTELLGRAIPLPQPLRLVIVCLTLAAF